MPLSVPLTTISFPSSVAPDVLYHYTRLDAFSSIVARRILWLSDIAKMNDAKERLWISELFERVLSKRRKAGAGFAEAAHYFYDFQLDTTPIFIASFSEDGDLLSQWRAYADDGRGVSIGFRTAQLGFPVESRFIDEFMEEQRVAIAKCMYDRGNQEVLIDELVAYFDHIFIELNANYEHHSMYTYDGFLSIATWCLRNLSAVSKHPGFSEEREWRALYWPNGYGEKEGFASASVGPRAHRAREGDNIAYHEWFLGNRDSVIAEIVLGPKSPFTEDNATKVLEAHGFFDFTVRHSEIPYR